MSVFLRELTLSMPIGATQAHPWAPCLLAARSRSHAFWFSGFTRVNHHEHAIWRGELAAKLLVRGRDADCIARLPSFKQSPERKTASKRHPTRKRCLRKAKGPRGGRSFGS